jgi:uncharacterized membrane protein
MMIGFRFGGVLFWGALLVLLAGGAVLALRQAVGTPTSESEEPVTARQMLDERLVRGEISREEYDAIHARIE